MMSKRDENTSDEANSDAFDGMKDGSAQYDCAAVTQNLLVFVHRECSEISYSRIEEHICDCEPCEEKADVEKKLNSLLSKKCCANPAPQHLYEAINTRISLDCGEASGEVSYVHLEQNITYYEQ